MSIFYADTPSRPDGPVSGYLRWPAVKKYLEYYGNLLILDAISKKPKDPAEKRQALKEMTMCEKKLAYWTRHSNFDQAEVSKGIALLKAQWNRTT